MKTSPLQGSPIPFVLCDFILVKKQKTIALWAQKAPSSTCRGSPLGRASRQDAERLTFPPVTEKLAKMQYFSFLWPV